MALQDDSKHEQARQLLGQRANRETVPQLENRVGSGNRVLRRSAGQAGYWDIPDGLLQLGQAARIQQRLATRKGRETI